MTPTTSGQLTATCSRYSTPTPIRITVPAIAPAGCCATTQADSSAASPDSTATILSTATSFRRADAAFSNVSITNKQIGRPHVRTPVTNALLVCLLLLAKKKKTTNNHKSNTTT